MKNIPDRINTIIEDLVDPAIKLSDILLKVQVLAFQIDNKSLTDWVNNELHGYRKKEKPDYREIPTAVTATIIEDNGFGNYRLHNKFIMPIEMLETKVANALRSLKLDSSVSEIEKMIANNGNYGIPVSGFLMPYLSKLINDHCQVQSAKQLIGNNSLEGVLSKIKSTLLTFLLELNKALGDNENLTIMKSNKKVDEIFNKTIGSISGEHVNITLGTASPLVVNNGNSNKTNLVAGDNNNQSIYPDLKEEVNSLILLLKESLNKLDLPLDEKEDISNEVVRVETQLKRDMPKIPIIAAALNTVYNVLLGVATNAYTPVILEKLSEVLPRLS